MCVRKGAVAAGPEHSLRQLQGYEPDAYLCHCPLRRAASVTRRFVWHM